MPEELGYTLEHAQGLSAAAKSGDKTIMQRAVDDLIGTTIKQNQALGFGGFEQTRNALVRDIQAGVNVKDNLLIVEGKSNSGEGGEKFLFFQFFICLLFFSNHKIFVRVLNFN